MPYFLRPNIVHCLDFLSHPNTYHVTFTTGRDLFFTLPLNLTALTPMRPQELSELSEFLTSIRGSVVRRLGVAAVDDLSYVQDVIAERCLATGLLGRLELDAWYEGHAYPVFDEGELVDFVWDWDMIGFERGEMRDMFGSHGYVTPRGDELEVLCWEKNGVDAFEWRRNGETMGFSIFGAWFSNFEEWEMCEKDLSREELELLHRGVLQIGNLPDGGWELRRASGQQVEDQVSVWELTETYRPFTSSIQINESVQMATHLPVLERRQQAVRREENPPEQQFPPASAEIPQPDEESCKCNPIPDTRCSECEAPIEPALIDLQELVPPTIQGRRPKPNTTTPPILIRDPASRYPPTNSPNPHTQRMRYARQDATQNLPAAQQQLPSSSLSESGPTSRHLPTSSPIPTPHTQHIRYPPQTTTQPPPTTALHQPSSSSSQTARATNTHRNQPRIAPNPFLQNSNSPTHIQTSRNPAQTHKYAPPSSPQNMLNHTTPHQNITESNTGSGSLRGSTQPSVRGGRSGVVRREKTIPIPMPLRYQAHVEDSG
ncbi:hypothetical protein BDW02DRAFT_622474 [Decorospora gaudefroyi]|uniref:Uncharacterized protein n=1 Tax=Decorospora gaudefroyi TaxID=184978 RepID=A0A6A5K864_9PLEO|nr:hypothetical protein BDW02DRAFT_622474 [Decorospora gaudefroyi]